MICFAAWPLWVGTSRVADVAEDVKGACGATATLVLATASYLRFPLG